MSSLVKLFIDLVLYRYLSRWFEGWTVVFCFQNLPRKTKEEKMKQMKSTKAPTAKAKQQNMRNLSRRLNSLLNRIIK